MIIQERVNKQKRIKSTLALTYMNNIFNERLSNPEMKLQKDQFNYFLMVQSKSYYLQ
ncbi:unnamed protein product [Paramecium octaurelia]|uniref:Uncharacterized protein n=1 Tax=Paramecium octaurelia TaxID=43137 RepID=A0A8S1YB17_PAROT|nr:unnamed protein product [Paramecium octaurelia]